MGAGGHHVKPRAAVLLFPPESAFSDQPISSQDIFKTRQNGKNQSDFLEMLGEAGGRISRSRNVFPAKMSAFPSLEL